MIEFTRKLSQNRDLKLCIVGVCRARIIAAGHVGHAAERGMNCSIIDCTHSVRAPKPLFHHHHPFVNRRSKPAHIAPTHFTATLWPSSDRCTVRAYRLID